MSPVSSTLIALLAGVLFSIFFLVFPLALFLYMEILTQRKQRGEALQLLGDWKMVREAELHRLQKFSQVMRLLEEWMGRFPSDMTPGDISFGEGVSTITRPGEVETSIPEGFVGGESGPSDMDEVLSWLRNRGVSAADDPEEGVVPAQEAARIRGEEGEETIEIVEGLRVPISSLSPDDPRNDRSLDPSAE